jgi:hypothetical protein
MVKRLLNYACFAILFPSRLVCGDALTWMQDTVALGIPAGAKAPGFELPDQSGRKRSMASLMDRRGLVLVFFRSADW